MILKRFYNEQLAQTSYLIGCGATGQAIVIDPNRAVEQYVEVARAERVRITHVAETHIHADFVSGTRELSARTGATMLLSAEGGADWQYGYGGDERVQLVRNGDRIRIGNVLVDVVHTPGHTPEHIVFFITDGAAADEPIGVVTGDFVFVGDVGRPDLLERAVNVQGTMEQSARVLFRSLQEFKRQPDYVQIWPGHGAGSACGKGLSAIPHSTVGYERRFNWAFGIADEDDFVATVLSGQPDPPRYFAQMKRINRAGPAVLGGLARPALIDPARLGELLQSDVIVIDTRLPHVFAAGHIPGTISIPLDSSFSTWAGWLVPYDRDIYLLAGSEALAADAAQSLALIGLDRVCGYFTGDALSWWTAQGRELERLQQMKVTELARRIEEDSVAVLDVRSRSEYDAGHLSGVSNIPLGSLPDRLDEVPAGKPLVLHCQSGARSAIAASLLQARGRTDVINLIGGLGEWQRAGQPVERDDSVAAEAP